MLFRELDFPNACGAMASIALAVSPTSGVDGTCRIVDMELGCQRLTEYKYAEQGGHDKDQSLRYEGRYEPHAASIAVQRFRHRKRTGKNHSAKGVRRASG